MWGLVLNLFTWAFSWQPQVSSAIFFGVPSPGFEQCATRLKGKESILSVGQEQHVHNAHMCYLYIEKSCGMPLNLVVVGIINGLVYVVHRVHCRNEDKAPISTTVCCFFCRAGAFVHVWGADMSNAVFNANIFHKSMSMLTQDN